jgi:hypothetical protein
MIRVELCGGYATTLQFRDVLADGFCSHRENGRAGDDEDEDTHDE